MAECRGQGTAAFVPGEEGMEGESLVQVWDSGSGPIKEPEAWEEVLMRAVSSLASKGPELSLTVHTDRGWESALGSTSPTAGIMISRGGGGHLTDLPGLS